MKLTFENILCAAFVALIVFLVGQGLLNAIPKEAEIRRQRVQQHVAQMPADVRERLAR